MRIKNAYLKNIENCQFEKCHFEQNSLHSLHLSLIYNKFTYISNVL